MEIIFGTDGWRGIIGNQVNHESVALVAQAFADYCKKYFDYPKIAVGFDGRKYSNEFAEIFSKVLSGNKIDVSLSDRIVPTPVLSFFVKKEGLDAGAMITASHNPAEYNGIKFKADYGGPFFTEATLKVEKLIGKSKPKLSTKQINTVNLFPPYKKQLFEIINFDSIRESKLKVLVDSMSGAGQTIIEEILKEADTEVTTIFSAADDSFSGRTAEPIRKNLSPLSKMLKEEKAFSIGLATDGDADRVGVMLETGEWLSSQETILALADYLVNVKKLEGDLVKTSSVTDKLKYFFQSPQRKVFDVQVGFKYICESMLKGNILFGCEESGGYGYKNHMPERDGILSSLLLIEMLAVSGCTKMSDYVYSIREKYGVVFYDRADIQYAAQNRMSILPKLFDLPPKQLAGSEVLSLEKFDSSRGVINGLKFTLKGASRWLLIRASETEPLIRIYAEGDSSNDVQNLLSSGEKLIFG